MAKNRRRNTTQAASQGTGTASTSTTTKERPAPPPVLVGQPSKPWSMCRGRGCISPVYTNRFAGFCDETCLKSNLDLL